MGKCAKMISVIIFSFLLVGGRGTRCTLAPQLRSQVYEEEDHGTTPMDNKYIKRT